jgi:1-aminocyclopropane-1-carboxylate deaminase/D-cysteine desulfhydrase-like pyridoxal-dependent ACC family enzyme
VTVSRSVADQKPKVVTLQQEIAQLLEVKASAEITLWDDYFAPGYGQPNDEGMEAVNCWRAWKVFFSILSIPARRWQGCLMD